MNDRRAIRAYGHHQADPVPMRASTTGGPASSSVGAMPMTRAMYVNDSRYGRSVVSQMR